MPFTTLTILTIHNSFRSQWCNDVKICWKFVMVFTPQKAVKKVKSKCVFCVFKWDMVARLFQLCEQSSRAKFPHIFPNDKRAQKTLQTIAKIINHTSFLDFATFPEFFRFPLFLCFLCVYIFLGKLSTHDPNCHALAPTTTKQPFTHAWHIAFEYLMIITYIYYYMSHQNSNSHIIITLLHINMLWVASLVMGGFWGVDFLNWKLLFRLRILLNLSFKFRAHLGDSFL